MESILKSTLKRQLPYLLAGTITGTFMTYYYGFLLSIIFNSIMWFAISTIVNKYYWHYTGFKDEFYLISKYIIHRKKNKSIINIQDNNKLHYYKSERPNNNKIDSLSKNTDDDKTNNIGSPLKL